MVFLIVNLLILPNHVTGLAKLAGPVFPAHDFIS